MQGVRQGMITAPHGYQILCHSTVLASHRLILGMAPHVHRAQHIVEEEGELGKHLTRQGFLTWAKRFPAVAATMRSLLAIGAAAAQDSGGSTAASVSSSGPGNHATSSSAAGDQRAADGTTTSGSQAGTGGRVQLPPVPQLISLQGISAASCLLRSEWAWAIATSGLLSAQVGTGSWL